MNKKYNLTSLQIEELIRLYPTHLNAELAKHFACSYSCISNYAYKYGLKKDKSFLQTLFRERALRPGHGGVRSRFTAGSIPANKGRKQQEYMSPAAIERTSITRFKSGQPSWNKKPVGHERVDKDGYLWVKVAEPSVFKQKHRVIWEQHNGTIPKGYNVQFRNGNPLDCNINNLYLISRTEQMRDENSMYVRYPKNLQLAIQAKGVLNRAINKLLKDN